MIDRQVLIALLDATGAMPASHSRFAEQEILVWRETLADSILALDKPPASDVTDSGTVFPELRPSEYAGGYHYPHGTSPGHKLIECNRRFCGPRL